MNGYQPHGPLIIDPPDYTQITPEAVAGRFPTTHAAALIGTVGTVLLHPVDGLPAVERTADDWGWIAQDGSRAVGDCTSTSLLLAVIRARHEAHFAYPANRALEAAAAALVKRVGRKIVTSLDRETAREILAAAALAER